jgi:uncharacterized membrane protein YkvA (DUF1232 family)
MLPESISTSGTLKKSLTDSDVPWYVKLLVGFIIAYIISPVDLIPDFIPVIGLLDEAILVPIGIGLALKLMPAEVMERYQQEDDKKFSKSLAIAGMVLVLLFWGIAIAAVTLGFDNMINM